MAQTLASSSPLLLITFLLFSITTPPAHAIFFPPPAQFIRATGQLCCTTTGNCPGNPVVGATVSLICQSFLTNIVVATNTTQADGSFTITGPTPPTLLNLEPKCYVSVNLPLSPAVCPALSTGGILTGRSNLIGILQYPGTVTTVIGLGTVDTQPLLFWINSLF